MTRLRSSLRHDFFSSNRRRPRHLADLTLSLEEEEKRQSQATYSGTRTQRNATKHRSTGKV